MYMLLERIQRQLFFQDCQPQSCGHWFCMDVFTARIERSIVFLFVPLITKIEPHLVIISVIFYTETNCFYLPVEVLH